MYGPGHRGPARTIAFGAVLVFVAVAISRASWARGLARVAAEAGARRRHLARDNDHQPEPHGADGGGAHDRLAVVVFVAVLAQDLKSSFIDSYDRTCAPTRHREHELHDHRTTPAKVSRCRRRDSVSLDAQQVQAEQVLPVVGASTGAIERVWSFDWIRAATVLPPGLDGAIVEADGDVLGVKQGCGRGHDGRGQAGDAQGARCLPTP
jgi:hypothetical protein